VRRTKRLFTALLLITLAVCQVVADNAWETDFNKARAQAKESGRYMLVNFTGSDWCHWCVKLEKEVFDKPAFRQYADENLLMVMIDFPKRTHLAENLKAQNDALLHQYGIRSLPTILILSPNGDLIAKTGYQRGGPDPYVAHLKSYIDPHRAEQSVVMKRKTRAAVAKPAKPKAEIAKPAQKEPEAAKPVAEEVAVVEAVEPASVSAPVKVKRRSTRGVPRSVIKEWEAAGLLMD